MFLVLAGVLILSACAEAPQTDEESAALIERYFKAQQDGDIKTAAAMYPLEQQQQWLSFLQQAVNDRGRVSQYVIESIEPNTVYSGKFYLATVRVNGGAAEEENAGSIEMVTAFRKLGVDQTFIVSHKIRSLH